MATTKKTSTKKKASPTKRAAVKSSSAARVKSNSRPVRKSAPKSLRLEKDQDNFMDTKLSNQSLYWIVLGIAVIAFAVWILKVQADVQGIYDKIESNSQAVMQTPIDYETVDEE